MLNVVLLNVVAMFNV